MFRVLYVSCAVRTFLDSQLRDFASGCQRRNEITGVTGICLYIDGNFMQAFEGPEAPTRELWERIRSDDRHRNVTVLLEEEAVERIFGDWSMDFRAEPGVPSDQLLSIGKFMDQTLKNGIDSNAPTAVRLLSRFVQTMH